MDKTKQQSLRADILAFPHMSRKEEQLLQTVLNHMSQGVLMFDCEKRLIFCNQRFIELYGLSLGVVNSNYRLGGLLQHRVKPGTFAGDPGEDVAWLTVVSAPGKTCAH